MVRRENIKQKILLQFNKEFIAEFELLPFCLSRLGLLPLLKSNGHSHKWSLVLKHKIKTLKGPLLLKTLFALLEEWPEFAPLLPLFLENAASCFVGCLQTEQRGQSEQLFFENFDLEIQRGVYLHFHEILKLIDGEKIVLSHEQKMGVAVLLGQFLHSSVGFN